MRKSSYIACPIEECRNRLGNVGIGYSDLGVLIFLISLGATVLFA